MPYHLKYIWYELLWYRGNQCREKDYRGKRNKFHSRILFSLFRMKINWFQCVGRYLLSCILLNNFCIMIYCFLSHSFSKEWSLLILLVTNLKVESSLLVTKVNHQKRQQPHPLYNFFQQTFVEKDKLKQLYNNRVF